MLVRGNCFCSLNAIKSIDITLFYARLIAKSTSRHGLEIVHI